MKTKPNTYNVNTVQDMIDCTNTDNIDAFLVDLRALLVSAHSINDMVKLVSQSKGLPKNVLQVESKGFTWIDDGKNNAKITIGTKIEK